MRSLLRPLWGSVVLFILGAVAVWFSLVRQAHDEELANAVSESRIANDASVDHTVHVVRQADVLLRAVRAHYQRTGSVPETEHFIRGLNVASDFVENIYIMDVQGWLLSPSDSGRLLNMSQREHFRFHQDTAQDRIHISTVSKGLVTGKQQFRLSRRLSHPDGAFAGVIVIPVEPTAFTRYYQQLHSAPDSMATLVGTMDRKIRARSPQPEDDAAWSQPLVSPLWAALEMSDAGSYQSTSSVDQLKRHYLYKAVPGLPLVMVTGFSDADVAQRVRVRMQPITLALVSAAVVVVLMAGMLTVIGRQHGALQTLATTDALTGLMNRREIMVTGEEEVARAVRYHTPLSLMMLDIDHFKRVNDTWGHPTGDRVIQALAQAMLSVVREHDVVGRYGGEEFLILLPHTDAQAVNTVAERLRALVESNTQVLSDQGETVRFTVSIGVATQTDKAESLSRLIALADNALYQAKAEGRNRVIAGVA